MLSEQSYVPHAAWARTVVKVNPSLVGPLYPNRVGRLNFGLAEAAHAPQPTPSTESSPPPLSSLDILTSSAIGLSNVEVKPTLSKVMQETRFGEGKFNVRPSSPSLGVARCAPSSSNTAWRMLSLCLSSGSKVGTRCLAKLELLGFAWFCSKDDLSSGYVRVS